MELPTSNSLNDPRAEAVLARLHAQGDREFKYLVAHGLKRLIFGWLTRTQEIDWAFLRDKLVPLHPDKCRLAYILCRSLQARRVVEFGTSFGVSTIYLAAAVRDNVRGETSGMVIGTEIEPMKAQGARTNLAEAGLADFVEVREGDATETLKDVGGPADFLLMDSWTDFARPIIEIVAPQLRPGAIVMADNVPPVPRGYRAYIEYVRNPANGFRSMNLPYKGGVELSVRAA
jgi:predicted O-methyltransferase YrrM